MTETILIGEDEPVQRQMLTALLTKKLGYKVRSGENGREVLKQVQASNIGEISAVLLDLSMPEMDGFEALKQLRKLRPDLPVVILTAQDDTSLAVKAIKLGASDFITKPADLVPLDVTLKNAIRLSALSRELAKLKRDKEGALSFHDIIGHDGALAEAVAYARKAAASDISVLMTGETSTGKELLARAIHGESRRMGAPFVAVHCGAIPPHTLESVLFGQEKNIQAGIGQRILGKFREAERGTIFLDDIHALPTEAQAKMLRVLQQREVEPVGAEKPVKAHVRVISATHRDLKAEVKAGRFREDLYFLLNVLTIPLPALRERKQDILPLAEYFLQHFSSLEALPLKMLSANARAYLTDYLWPGNLRELEGLMHRALVMCEEEMIERDLLKQLHMAEAGEGAAAPGMQITLRNASGFFKTLAEIETEAMEKTLEYYEQNITRAAEALGMAKSTFYRKWKAMR